jgi:hypothetical protein
MAKKIISIWSVGGMGKSGFGYLTPSIDEVYGARK